jgi:phage gp37-like protein
LDALGEADCLVGDRAGAQIAFARAAQLDSTDTTPIEMLRRLRP